MLRKLGQSDQLQIFILDCFFCFFLTVSELLVLLHTTNLVRLRFYQVLLNTILMTIIIKRFIHSIHVMLPFII